MAVLSLFEEVSWLSSFFSKIFLTALFGSLINNKAEADKTNESAPKKPNVFRQPRDLIISTESDDRPHPT